MTNPRIQILDGGMGATLDALGYDVSGPMWGGELLDGDPDAIRKVHEGYVEAGADIIETGTYQISLPNTFDIAEFEVPKRRMRIALDLALDCASGSSGRGRRRKVALSIGPYGAILTPGQEYTGAYPPPCGLAPSGGNYATDQEAAGIDHALTNFHLQRLMVYSILERWRELDYIAFETIPVLAEIRAIRRAMAHFPPSRAPRDWWITCPFPSGRFPPGTSSAPPDARPIAEEVKQVMEAMLLPLLHTPPHKAPTPKGIGINCSNPSYIRSLAREFSSCLVDLRKTGKVRGAEVQGVIWVMYPDGGASYDPATKTWTSRAYDAEAWAKEVADVAQEMEALESDGERVWAGVVVGGCCKASFDEIRALRGLFPTEREGEKGDAT